MNAAKTTPGRRTYTRPIRDRIRPTNVDSGYFFSRERLKGGKGEGEGGRTAAAGKGVGKSQTRAKGRSVILKDEKKRKGCVTARVFVPPDESK